MHINTASSSNFFGCERKCKLMFSLTPNASARLAPSNKFAYLMSKSIFTLHRRATHNTCMEDRKCGKNCRIVSLLFPPAKLRNNELEKFKEAL